MVFVKLKESKEKHGVNIKNISHRSPKQNDSISSLNTGHLQGMGNYGMNMLIQQMLSQNESSVLTEKDNGGSNLPQVLRERLEKQSGLSLEDIRVHYNSHNPQKIGAKAYTEGKQIYIAPKQENTLEHEVIHAVQQKQGRVPPEIRIGGTYVNQSLHLEQEANHGSSAVYETNDNSNPPGVIQMVLDLGEIALKRFDKKINEGQEGSFRAYFNGLIHNDANELGLPNGLIVELRTLVDTNENFSKNQVDAAIRDYYNVHQANFEDDVNGDGNGLNFDGPVKQHLQDILRNSLIGNDDNPGLLSQAHEQAAEVTHDMDDSGLVPGIRSIRNDGIMKLFNRKKHKEDMAYGVTFFRNLLGENERGHLPEVNIRNQAFTSSSYGNGELVLGTSSSKSQVTHEMGHNLEDNLAVNDFATVHNFLRARTRAVNNGDRNVGYGGLSQGTGYNAVLPHVDFSHPINQFVDRHPSIIQPYLLMNPSQRLVDDYFLHNSNNEDKSYATMNYGGGSDFSTEFTSTTAEMFSREDSLQKLINADPLRVALFLYVSNKELYNQIKDMLGHEHEHVNLDELIHAIN